MSNDDQDPLSRVARIGEAVIVDYTNSLNTSGTPRVNETVVA